LAGLYLDSAAVAKFAGASRAAIIHGSPRVPPAAVSAGTWRFWLKDKVEKTLRAWKKRTGAA
jgi:hypothetical protein